MKALPPTLRINKRYILGRIVPHDLALDGKDLYYALYEAVSSLYGDAGASKISMSIVHTQGNWVIAQCTRGSEEMLETAISTLTNVAGINCAIRPVQTSGTILTLKEIIQRSEKNILRGDLNLIESAVTSDASSAASAVASTAASNCDPLEGIHDETSGEINADNVILINDSSYQPNFVSNLKVDLSKKGTKNKETLYFTITDIKE